MNSSTFERKKNLTNGGCKNSLHYISKNFGKKIVIIHFWLLTREHKSQLVKTRDKRFLFLSNESRSNAISIPICLSVHVHIQQSLPNRTLIQKKTDYWGLPWPNLSQFVCQLQICRRLRGGTGAAGKCKSNDGRAVIFDIFPCSALRTQ